MGLACQNTIRKNVIHGSILVMFDYVYGLKPKLMVLILQNDILGGNGEINGMLTDNFR